MTNVRLSKIIFGNYCRFSTIHHCRSYSSIFPANRSLKKLLLLYSIHPKTLQTAPYSFLTYLHPLCSLPTQCSSSPFLTLLLSLLSDRRLSFDSRLPRFISIFCYFLHRLWRLGMDMATEFDDEEFGFSRNYFLAKEMGGSVKKSAHKLSDIDLVDEQELRSAMANTAPRHEKEVQDLMNNYRSLYSKWVFKLRCGFGLLMYGFGSKKALIEDFASKALTEHSVVVINGYLQSINIKQVLIALAEILFEQLKNKQKGQHPISTRSTDDLLVFLNSSDVDENDCFICVVIHNIDGPGLRESETQQILARLSCCSNVRVVASIDHVNAPLLWDKKMVHTQFNWCWYHVPTFAPYSVEGTFFPLILANGNSTQTAKTAALVLLSLTPNGQSVFRVIAEFQLSHPDDEGMPFDDLYAVCRERFLASNQVTLNSHLTEFKDHELVKTRRHPDGQDCLYIPLPSEALQKLLVEISE